MIKAVGLFVVIQCIGLLLTHARHLAHAAPTTSLETDILARSREDAGQDSFLDQFRRSSLYKSLLQHHKQQQQRGSNGANHLDLSFSHVPASRPPTVLFGHDVTPLSNAHPDEIARQESDRAGVSSASPSKEIDDEVSEHLYL